MSPSSSSADSFNVYATLLTRPSYLAGAILLSHTLHKHSPSTPLIILYTPGTLPKSAVKALEEESQSSKCILYPIEYLRLPASEADGKDDGIVAERFIDTWTKLRVFEILEVNGRKIDRLCFLDADMMILCDPSPLIFNTSNDEYLSASEGEGHRIAATHVCVCNLDSDSWAPSSWKKENCAFTPLPNSDAIAPVDPSSETKGIFNSGTFVFHPSPSIQTFVLDAFKNTPVNDLRKLKFPDQDFLNTVFHDRWASLSWRTNALKTWRYWHPNIWADDQVAVLHYIVDKPWTARVKTSVDNQNRKIAGYKGDDGETHSWWWDEFELWKTQREQDSPDLVVAVGKYVAGEKGYEDLDDDMKAIGHGAQGFASKWKDEKKAGGDDDSDKKQEPEQGPHGPILRKKVLGERGHGPVVRNPDFVQDQQHHNQQDGKPRKWKIPPMGSSYMEP
ncbi:glycosyltransferase family 8 protein [Periconia macrospinosa]|uniref:Glycosyltransferase family 8 protein n=1 Tax=Periconia macrospinosa TaxID=97972 RepID=A0A2V1DYJ7_9PLEO|nr:glycosyltransferase family 8 protein [Periconia macrospinosa]